MTRLTLILSFLLTLTVAYGQKPVKVLVKENEKSVFLVQCFNEKNEMVSTGSGFFIDKSGVAFTNVHVIKDAFKARIKTIDGKFYDVERLIDYNPSLDIAKIRIKNSNGISFPAVRMATNKSEKGDDVFTIGNPDGLESSISTGIISSVRAINNYGECYQITAPISPGSSGGALFNMNGEVIGITTFGQIDANRLNQNLNFAVNINNSKYLSKNKNLALDKAYKDLVYEDLISACMKAQIIRDYQKQFEISNNAIKKNSTNWVAYHFRGNANYYLEEYQNAENDILKAIQLNKTTVFLAEDYNTLGIIYRRSKQYEKASQSYMKALDVDKEFSSCYCNIAVLLTEYYDPEKGPDNNLIEFFYTKSLEKDPTGCAFGYKSLATKAKNAGDIQLAIKFLTASIEIEKSTDESLSINEYNNRGQAYIMLKDYANAIEDFKYCTKLNPYDAESYAYIGYCYAKLNRKTDACASLNKAKGISERIATEVKVKTWIENLLSNNCE